MKKQQFAKLILWILGWRVSATEEILKCKKYVLLSGPHTSIWDFIIGKATYLALGIEGKFLIKQEFFKWPLGYWLKKMGGLPINRSSPKEFVKWLNSVQEMDDLILIITPEGTRKKTNHWKEGFYSIARKGQMPVFIGTLNYKSKVCHIGDPFKVTGDFETDIKQVEQYYRPEYAKHPERFAYHGQVLKE
jgi:1-acyl-sn-glycerol-3-phosphate acyltransferase